MGYKNNKSGDIIKMNQNQFILELTKLTNRNNEAIVHYLKNNELDWSSFLETIVYHKVGNIIYKNILTMEIKSLFPDFIILILKNFYKSVLNRNQILEEEWLSIIKETRANNINVITLKGQALSNRLYKVHGLRTYADIDILLFKKEDFKVVDTIFKKYGYTQGELEDLGNGNYKINEISNKRLEGYATELQHYGEYVKLTGNHEIPLASFDLHYRLTTEFDDYEFDMDDIKKTVIKENGFYYMSNEYQLLHLCTHLYWHTRSIREFIAHRDNNLKDYLDIYELLENTKIDNKEMQRILNMQNTILIPACYSLKNVYALYNSEKAKELLGLFATKEIQKELLGIGDRWILKNNKNFAYWNKSLEELVFDYKKHEYALKMMYKNILDYDLIEK